MENDHVIDALAEALRDLLLGAAAHAPFGQMSQETKDVWRMEARRVRTALQSRGIEISPTSYYASRDGVIVTEGSDG